MLSRVRKVEIELQSYCNRKCNWCPNKDIDRSKSIELDEKVYLKLMRELKENNFARDMMKGVISFSRFNEPLWNIDLLVKRVYQARLILNDKKINFVANTNGDFLTKEKIKRLNLDELSIMDYDCKGMDYAVKRLRDLGVEIKEINRHIIVGRYDRMIVRYFVDWPKHALLEDRAGYFKEDIYYYDSQENRTKKMRWRENRKRRVIKCRHPMYFIAIDYNGNVMPCCHMRSDNPEHKDFILGNIYEQYLIDIYYSEKAVEFRRLMFKGDFKNYYKPCMYCQKPDDYFVTFKEEV